MDVVTQSLLREFATSQNISSLEQSDQFESFINYIIVSDIYHEEFDFNIISTGKGEFGIDGIAIIVNDTIVDDEEQLEDLIEHSSVLQVEFVFVQSKTSSSIDTGDLAKFFHAIQDFFVEKSSLNQNTRIIELRSVKDRIFQNAPKFARGLPRISAHYAYTGRWQSDANVLSMRDSFVNRVTAMNLFSSVVFDPVDAAKIQKLYFQTKNSYKVTISFGQSIPLPEIPNVREAHIGLVKMSEYLKIITDADGNVRRKLFFDNIRDYQGSTPVNMSIAGTIKSDRCIEFPLRHNGITIVTRKFQRVGTQLVIEDFQIVNGCQTSHVIAENATVASGETLIPIKIISTEDEDVTRQVIIASNSQNKIDDGSFWTLEPIHKAIEILFDSKNGDQKLYYERRPGQFNTISGIEKVRVVTKDGLLKNFASMFLEQPNQVGRYYKDLSPLIGKEIFNPLHDVSVYYTAAYAAYRLEFMFRNRRIESDWKPFRFQILMATRLIIEVAQKLKSSSKMSRNYCSTIDSIMFDIEKSQAIFEKAISVIAVTIPELEDKSSGRDRRTAKMRDMRDRLRDAVLKKSF